MNHISVPPDALKSEEDFTKWFKKTRDDLFYSIEGEEYGIDSLKTEESIEKKFYTIARYFNLVFNGTDQTVNLYKKKMKHNCSNTDIIATSCNILLSRFSNIRLTTIAKIIGSNHSTIVYYKKRTEGMLMMREFRAKYLRLISLLENERIISPIETEEFKPKRVLSTVLPEL